NVVSSAGYLNPDDRLQLAITPSRLFPLSVNVVDREGTIDLSLADWEVSFAAENEEPIMTAYLSGRFRVKIGEPLLTANDPDNYIVTLQMEKDHSQIWLTPKPDGNRTFIPGSLLLADLRDKLQVALDAFSQEGKEISFPIPRTLAIPSGSIFSDFGLSELTWGSDGFQIEMDPINNQIRLQATPLVR
ncbi:MAG: hypothetical protein Q7S68_03950, partial [Deltaproteobacteria bacterium]|nr:hypothetical protein [Deltaproteobacteria bacterium]